MKVICIDDSNRPSDVPLSKWIVKGRTYTELKRYKGMNGVEIVEIEEIDLASIGSLYKGYASTRFRPVDSVDGIVLKEEKELVC